MAVRPGSPLRLNIYVDSAQLRDRVKVAAARAGVSVSAYCQESIRRRLEQEGLLPPSRAAARAAAEDLDRIRRTRGPLGVSVSDLVAEGRRR